MGLCRILLENCLRRGIVDGIYQVEKADGLSQLGIEEKSADLSANFYNLLQIVWDKQALAERVIFWM